MESPPSLLHGIEATLCNLEPSDLRIRLHSSRSMSVFKATGDQLKQLLAAATMGGDSREARRPGRALDTPGVRVPEFDCTVDKQADCAPVFRKTICAVSMEAFIALEYAERNHVTPDEQGLGDADLRISAKLFDILGNVFQGDALAILRGVEDCRGVYGSSKLDQRYTPRTTIGRIHPLEKSSRRQTCALSLLWRRGGTGTAVWRQSLGRDSDAGQVACVTAMLLA